MRRDGLPLLLVFAGAMVFLFAGSFLFAQQAPAPGGPNAALPGEETESRLTITAEFKDQTLRSVLDFIAEKSGHSIVPKNPADIEGLRVTIKFTAMPWREAVDRACDQVGCVASLVDTTVMVEKPPRVTMEFKRAELTEVINLLAKQAGANIVIDKDVKGEVTMRFSDVPWMKALDAVVKTAGFAMVEEDRGRIIRVVDPTKLEMQLESRVFKFKYLKPQETYRAQITSAYATGGTPTISAAGGGGGGGSSSVTQADVINNFTLLNALRAMLTKPPGAQAAATTGVPTRTIGRLEYFIETNSILVVDTKPVLDRMQQIIQDLDTEPEMVLCDVTFVQTRNEDFVQMGVDWLKGQDHGLTASFEPTSKIPATGGNGIGGSNVQAGGASLTKYPFNLGPSLLHNPIEQGYLNNYDMTATLRLFSQDTDSEFIQRPNVATRSNVETTIFVGQEIHYAQTTASSGQAGTLQFSIAEAAGSPVKVGFQLFLIPHVVSGTNKILMTVIPQNSALIGTTSNAVRGFNTFTVSSGGGVNESIDLPELQTEAIVTHMLLESGQTMVVGGLLQDRTEKVLNKIPWAGDIPVLGWLFKQKQDTVEKEHLFVFITPRITYEADTEKRNLMTRNGMRLGEVDQEFHWIQVGSEDQTLQRALEGRKAQNEKELQNLQQGPAPAGPAK